MCNSIINQESEIACVLANRIQRKNRSEIFSSFFLEQEHKKQLFLFFFFHSKTTNDDDERNKSNFSLSLSLVTQIFYFISFPYRRVREEKWKSFRIFSFFFSSIHNKFNELLFSFQEWKCVGKVFDQYSHSSYFPLMSFPLFIFPSTPRNVKRISSSFLVAKSLH